MKMDLSREEFVKFLWDSWRAVSPCDVKALRKTQFDTEEIIRLRELMGHLPQSTGYLEDRTQLRRNIYNQLIEGDVTRDRQAVLVCGLPASGKSGVAEMIRLKLNARIIDSDLAKEHFPEFNGGKFAQMVHEESDQIRNEVLEECWDRGENIILPIVGKSYESVFSLYNGLRGNEYDVHLRFLSCDPKESARRVVERYKTSGRFVDPLYALNVSDKPMQVFSSLCGLAWKSRRLLRQDEIDAYLIEEGF